MTSHPPTPPPAVDPMSPPYDPRQAAPPRGPGVPVPFAAPPNEKNSAKLALAIVSAVVGVVVVCGGGTVAGFGILVWTSNELVVQAESAAEEFLEDVAGGDYDDAYDSLCGELKDDLTEDEFVSEWEQIGVVDFETDRAVESGSGLEVPAEVTTDEGDVLELDLTVVPDEPSLDMSVCDW